MKTIDQPCPSEPPWPEGLAIVAALQRAGHQAYAVGGCVRDLLLGRAVKDVDVATSAHPEQVEACFSALGTKTVAVGRSFGVVVVVTPDGRHFEVATFRHDGAYIDGRHPTGIVFSTVEDDVNRRDFTINTLLFEPSSQQIVDHVGGLDDLEHRLLRAVGDAVSRLREDRLRVLRGLRFAAQLGLTIETSTWEALRSTTLEGLSSERLMQEWWKGLAGPRRGAWLGLLRSSGQLAAFCPPLAALPIATLDRLERDLERGHGDDPPALSAALWLSPAGAAGSAWLARQPLAANLVKSIHWLLDHAGDPGRILASPLADRRRLLQHETAGALIRLLEITSNDPGAVRTLAEEYRREQAAGSWRALIRAADLLDLGYAPGPGMGRLLRRLEDAQLEGRFTDRSDGLALAKRWLDAAGAGGETDTTAR